MTPFCTGSNGHRLPVYDDVRVNNNNNHNNEEKKKKKKIRIVDGNKHRQFVIRCY